MSEGSRVHELSTDTCLCQSGLPLFIETNVVAILATTIAGESVVTSILTQLVCVVYGSNYAWHLPDLVS